MAIPEMQAIQKATQTDTLTDDAALMAMSQENNPRPVIGMESMPMKAATPPPSPISMPVESPKTFNTMLKKIATEIGLPNLVNNAISPEVKKVIEKKEEQENQVALQQKAIEDNIIMQAMQRYSQDQNAATESGGLIGMAEGGGFSGKVPGRGHGMEDNVYMPIVEREEGSQVGVLAVSPDEYVVDAHTMSALGNGSADAGAEVMDKVVKSVRSKAYGTTQQPNEINGLAALRPMIERV
tara:strand:+ start:1007 stop:1723 length:717 start_codon:yes stop_codon:yes gene_type:complete